MLVNLTSNISIRNQCDYLGIARSSFYHVPKGESDENLRVMQLMDKHILEEPTAGVLTMQSMLKDHDVHCSYERVRRLMRKANIRAIYPRKHLSVLGEKKYIYPYLLRNQEISKSNQVWEIDISYIPMQHGFMYLTAIIDVYSRYIVGWGLSNSLDADSSLKVVKEAVATHGKPEILNSDQGCQFTCKAYVEYLKRERIQISMDGRGRALDNIYIERFWRTIKYQYIYLNPSDNGLDLYQGIKKWMERYHNRDHQGIGRNKPALIYCNAA
ncbi:IS3 family transposase [Labilibaculum filiforme]|uniref:IS3 family transposase n=1 Tax=Labilibaculum filiforme TaxID=1940526 RepID=UPI002481B4DE|nr:IS3 family transposase [Labilibaculum filiforme]